MSLITHGIHAGVRSKLERARGGKGFQRRTCSAQPEVLFLGHHVPSISGPRSLRRFCRVCLKAQKTPQDPAKTLIFEYSAEQHTSESVNAFINALIQPAECLEGVLGVFCSIFRDRKRGEHGPIDAPEKLKIGGKPNKSEIRKIKNKNLELQHFGASMLCGKKKTPAGLYFCVTLMIMEKKVGNPSCHDGSWLTIARVKASI